MRLTNVLICGVSAKAENERSPPDGHRNVSDSIRRRDVGGWAVVYRKKVSQASGRPSRTNGVGPRDKPFANLPSVKSKLSLLVRMHPLFLGVVHNLVQVPIQFAGSLQSLSHDPAAERDYRNRHSVTSAQFFEVLRAPSLNRTGRNKLPVGENTRALRDRPHRFIEIIGHLIIQLHIEPVGKIYF
jgi:hypothetical protein